MKRAGIYLKQIRSRMVGHMATTAEKAPEKATKICSKCGDGTPPDYDVWCGKCRSKYAKERDALAEWRAERRGIIRGILAMREHIAAHFVQWGGRPFMAQEITSIVNSLPGPAVADESAKRES